MANGRNSAIARRGLAGLACIFAFSGSSIAGAGAGAVSASAMLSSIQSTSQIVDAWRDFRLLRYGVFDNHARAAGYSANPSAFLLFACRIEWCAGSASTVSGTNSLALTGISTVETPVKWQSSFNVVGSRVWSKFIKFTRNGINVRVPLN